ncbi:hypothetical protein [Imhoffiella purpurea]|uniref:Uncharacterized protein n=1 Tax=Imhoffiella purpurea TaxID=1249627 RepID=W9V244_9GAMM|nr:hypothetical protein [Imhoffiella purpurea]EXJ13374.1 hypothetical protein D779_3770 [Imhoffiella purpurea]
MTDTVIIVCLLAVALVGCASPSRSGLESIGLSIGAPIEIPPQRAHAILQNGRLAGSSNKIAPYCELEVRRVSGEEPQWIRQGTFRIGRVSERILIDPTTRIPAFFQVTSCSDPLFQESVWWLESQAPSQVLFLRCIAPYYNCRFGPPLSVEQVRQVVGDHLIIDTAEPAGRSSGR